MSAPLWRNGFGALVGVLCAFGACCTLGLGVAGASPHETFIDVETEQDLYDAIAARLISSETFDRLRELLVRGVSLDTATREELYQLPNLSYAEVDAVLAARQRLGGLADGSVLVAAQILTQRQLDAIAPFLRGPGGQLGGEEDWSAWAQLSTRVRQGDRELPSLALRLRAARGSALEAGLALAFTRLRLGAPIYDPNRGALLAEAPRQRVELAKAFVRWRRASFEGVAGSYQVGFAQRVTFDDTGASQPAGALGDDVVAPQAGSSRTCLEVAAEATATCDRASGEVSPDVYWREGLWGLAISYRKALGATRQLALHSWASWAPRSLPASELVSRQRCDPAASPNEPTACAALPVLRMPSGPLLAATTRWSAPRLTAVFAERLIGARGEVTRAGRWSLGLTGYAARLGNLVGGAALAPAEGSRWPAARTFGAVGVDVSRGNETTALGLEVTRSFEAGASAAVGSAASRLAAVTRAVWSSPRRELELGTRYYGASFVNPYTRSSAAADELDGLRARDEAGMRARYALLSPVASLRLGVDAWSRSTRFSPKLAAQLRGEWQARSLRLGLSLSYDDKDLRYAGARQCFEGSGRDEHGAVVPCRGARVGASGRLAWLGPSRELVVAASYDAIDDGDGQRAARRHAGTAWLLGRMQRESGVALRAQLRWRDEQLGRAGAWAGQAAIELLWPRGAQLVRARLDGSFPPGEPARATASIWLTYQVGWQ